MRFNEELVLSCAASAWMHAMDYLKSNCNAGSSFRGVYNAIPMLSDLSDSPTLIERLGQKVFIGFWFRFRIPG